MKKILYGVSGIGNGHANRELPIISELARDNKIVILCYQDSWATFKRNFADHPNIKLIEIAVPFVVGTTQGLSFSETAIHPANQDVDFLKIDCSVLDSVAKEIGIPDLVISDYEPISAQYAYANNAPLVTIDQQSKFLYADLPKSLSGFTFEDEIERLHMFFPKAATRIACSFFRTKKRIGGDEVIFFPPPIKPAITAMKRKPAQTNQILVYISSAREFVQTPQEIIDILSNETSATFHLFIKGDDLPSYRSNAGNIKLYPHGSPEFIRLLTECDGIICTAGHSLLSEAMYLAIPVYAIPVEPYEQWLNAKAIGDNGFGIDFPSLEPGKLTKFIENLDRYGQNIRADKDVLIRGVGQDLIVYYLRRHYLSRKKILLLSPPFSGHLNLMKELIKDTGADFDYHLAITGWNNINPDLSGLENLPVTRLDAGTLFETDPALWTFDRAAKLTEAVTKLTEDFKPDLIIYDFFSVEGNLAGRLKKIPYWCSIPALIGAFDNKEYCQEKLSQPINQKALSQIKEKFGIEIGSDEVEMVSDGFHLPGQINLIWSFEEITPKNFRDGRADYPYVFVGNLRGDNYEKCDYRNRKPLIYFSFGTVVMDNLWNQQEETRKKLKEFVSELADRWKDRDYQVIFVTQGKEVLSEYPQNWWVYDRIEQVELLSRADIFITHGGSNSFHEGIMQKVPLLLIPFFGDQLLVGKTAESVGVGIKVGGSESIDTHGSKNFLSKELVYRLDMVVSETLATDKYAVRYIDMSLSFMPVASLLFCEIPFGEGDLILGEAVSVPKAKEELPVKPENYLDLLALSNNDLPSKKIKNITTVLRKYLQKTPEEKKKMRIIDFFSRIYTVHCPEDKTDPEIEGVKNTLASLGKNVIFYQREYGVWLAQKRQLAPRENDINIESGEIILTSENGVKVEALRRALGEKAAMTNIKTIDPKLPFDEQLLGTDEIAFAAVARLEAVRKMVGVGPTIISTVSGLIQRSFRYVDVAIVVSENESGEVKIAMSKEVTLPLAAVQKAKLRRFARFTVGSVIGEEAASHETSFDPHKLLMKGKLTRARLLSEAMKMVLL